MTDSVIRNSTEWKSRKVARQMQREETSTFASAATDAPGLPVESGENLRFDEPGANEIVGVVMKQT